MKKIITILAVSLLAVVLCFTFIYFNEDFNAEKKYAKEVANKYGIDIDKIGYDYARVEGMKTSIKFLLNKEESTTLDGFVKMVDYLKTISDDGKVYNYYDYYYSNKLTEEEEWNADDHTDLLVGGLATSLMRVNLMIVKDGKKYKIDGSYSITAVAKGREYPTYHYTFTEME